MPASNPTTHWDPPVLDIPIDVDFYMRSCPSEATVQGVFLQDIFKIVVGKFPAAAERVQHGLSQRRWVVFKSYPLRDFMRLAVNASKILYESLPLSEGLRRLGRTAFPSLNSTMAGKVVLFALGNTLEAAFRNAPKAYRLVLPQSEVTVDVGEKRGRIDLRGVYNFATTYHYGVFEGTIAEHGFQPRIRILPGASWCEASFDVAWS